MKRGLNVLLILFVVANVQCGKSDKSQADNKKTETKVKSRFVSATGGLRMRDKPDTTGNKLGTIPTGTKVDLLEETGKDMTIAGATGKWSKVKWGDKTGWVFGGFLAEMKMGSKTDSNADGFTGSDSLIGKTIIFPQLDSRDELKITLYPDHTVRGDFLTEEYSGGKIEGKYRFGDFKGGVLEVIISGKLKLITVTDKEVIVNKSFESKSVRIANKGDGFVGWNEIPFTTPFIGSKIILSSKTPKYK